MKNKKTIDSRRSFLKGLGGSAAALSVLPSLEMLIQASLNRAFAEITDAPQETNYLHLSMPGGPPRWMWDLPLTPNGAGDSFTENPMVITYFNEATKRGEYRTLDIKGHHLPLLWGANIPRVGNSNTAMSGLLDNMLMIRGYRCAGDGHPTNRMAHIQPQITSPSLSGLIADNSTAPIPAAAYRNIIAYRSPKARSYFAVPDLKTLLDNLQLNGGASYTQKNLENLIDQSLKALEQNVDRRNTRRKNLYEARIRAKKLFKKDFGNLTDVFSNLTTKYSSLVSRSLTDQGLAIGQGIDSGDFLKKGQIAGIDPKWYDVHGAKFDGLADHELPAGSDFRAALAEQSKIGHLSQLMAMTEFVFKEGITSSMTGYSASLSGFRASNKGLNIGHDSHSTGAISTLFAFSKYYQALSACLHEFRSQMINDNLFDKTVIQISSEFNRSARMNGSGSDHGWRGSNTTFLTGKVKELTVIGNTTSNGNGWHGGSWGTAGPMEELGNRPMTIGNMISSASVLLGVKSPSPNSESLISNNNGVIKKNVGAKNV